MSSSKSKCRGDYFPDTSVTENEPFRMLAIYDSQESGLEAARASDVVLRGLGDDVTVDRKCWDIRALEDASALIEAAEEAARADVIVVALSDEEVTVNFKEWAELWQGKRNVSGGLLALIPSGEMETGGELAEFLYETAVTAHMDFLSRTRSRF